MKSVWIIFFILTMLTACSSSYKTEQSVTSEVDAVTDEEEGVRENLLDTVRMREDAKRGDPNWSPVIAAQEADLYTGATGSLFSQSRLSNLYDGKRPKSVGDIITVVLEEKNQASKSASAELGKSTGFSMQPTQIGGQTISVGKYDMSYDINNDNTFSGNADAGQSNSMSGFITVEVIEVYPNGNLSIRGEKWLTLNTGEEYIRLNGTIRVEDIEPDNTIKSTRISNARIKYSGTGSSQDAQEPNMLAKFFNIIS